MQLLPCNFQKNKLEFLPCRKDNRSSSAITTKRQFTVTVGNGETLLNYIPIKYKSFRVCYLQVETQP